MYNNKVLALKWRPKNFKDFIGNNNVIKIILNSLKYKKIYSTYLFYGPKGVGKTSLSRLLSKSLNCELGINGNFCLKCSNCLSISKGKSCDVIEIDGASKSKLEDIKDILDSIYYLPINMRYKIYIIDEVHMLSRYSFNALLKVLEEPPKYVKFIFATTEYNKIPNTILSRCMCFYLKPLSIDEIYNRLIYICKKESYKFEKSALELISINSEGSLRDALILLEQLYLIKFKIKLKYVNIFFNKVDDYLIFNFLKNLFKKKYNKILSYLDIFLNSNMEYNDIFLSILDKLYKLLLIKIIPNINSIKFNIIKNKENILYLSKYVNIKDIKHYYNIFLYGKTNLLNYYDKKIFFEYLIFKTIIL